MNTLYDALKDRQLSQALRQWLEAVGFEKYPDLGALRGIEQGKDFHRLNVLEHSLETADHLEGREAALRLAGFLHDVGKPPTFTVDLDTDRITFPDHAEVGAGLIPALIECLVEDGQLPSSFGVSVDDDVLGGKVFVLGKDGEMVQMVAKNHMRVHWLADDLHKVTDAAVRRLVNACDRFLMQTILVCKADRLAQFQQTTKTIEALLDRINGFGSVPIRQQPKSQYLTGEEITELVGGPGPEVGKAKLALVAAEMHGHVTGVQAAIDFVKSKAYAIGACCI